MEFIQWLFFGPAKLIAHWHYAGVFIGSTLIVGQLVLALRARRPLNISFFRAAPVFAGLLWWIFNAYELQISAVGAGAALRIDLVVLVPILYVLTIAAVVTILRSLGGNRPKPD